MNDIIVKRIFAFLIDGVIVTLPFQIIAFQIWDYLLKNYADELIYIIMAYQFLPYLIYFFISEMFFSKTIGKKIMNLKVVVEKDKFISILVRTICRLIPFDVITFIFFKDKLLHDYLSKTRVVSN